MFIYFYNTVFSADLTLTKSMTNWFYINCQYNCFDKTCNHKHVAKRIGPGQPADCFYHLVIFGMSNDHSTLRFSCWLNKIDFTDQ